MESTAQNRIVVVGGANARFEVDARALDTALQGASNLLLQFEVPLPQVMAAARQARQRACPVVLNPSPMQPIPDVLWPLVDTLVANEVEAALFADCDVQTPEDAAHAARLLRARGPRQVVVTLGAAGAVACDGSGCRHHPGLRVDAVDTTAAGDTFLGAPDRRPGARRIARPGGADRRPRRGAVRDPSGRAAIDPHARRSGRIPHAP